MTDYEGLLMEYCDYAEFKDKQRGFLLKPYIYEKDLFHLNVAEYSRLILNDMCGLGGTRGSKNPSYLYENFIYIKNFFQWCVEKGITQSNPYLEFEELSYKNLVYQMIEKTEVVVIYDKDVDTLADRAAVNRELYELVVRLLYAGLTLREIGGLRISDLDRVKCGILLKDRTVECPGAVFDAADRYLQVDEFQVNNAQSVNKYKYHTYCDFVIKTIEKNLKVEDIPDGNTYSYLTANKLGRMVNRYGIHHSDISSSGMLNQLRKSFRELNDQEFCGLFQFSQRKFNRGESGKINKIGLIYGKKNPRSAVIIKDLLPYLIKSKYYR